MQMFSMRSYYIQTSMLLTLLHVYLSFIFIILLFYFMCVGVLLPRMSIHHMLNVDQGQRRVFSPLELELQTVESRYVGGGNQPWALWKSNQCFNSWAISPTLARLTSWDRVLLCIQVWHANHCVKIKLKSQASLKHEALLLPQPLELCNHKYALHA